MKKILAIILSLSIITVTVAFAVSAAEKDNYGYSALELYEMYSEGLKIESLPKLTAEENHALLKEYSGMSDEEIVEYELARAGEYVYMKLYLVYNYQSKTPAYPLLQEFLCDSMDDIVYLDSGHEYVGEELFSTAYLKIKTDSFEKVVSHEYVVSYSYPFPEPISEYYGVLGDITGDGKVLMYDVTVFAKHLAGFPLREEYANAELDVNRDYLVNILDVIEIAKMIVE